MGRKPVNEVKNEVIHIRVTGKRKAEMQSVANYLGITVSAVGSMAVSEYLNTYDGLQEVVKDDLGGINDED